MANMERYSPTALASLPMDITEAELNWVFGCLLILGLLLAYPALTTAIALLRAKRTLGGMFWHVVTMFDRHRRR